MDEMTRSVAWAIAEAWWRQRNRVAAGSVPEASSSTEYADNFWQGWVAEAKAAFQAMERCAEMRAAAAQTSGAAPAAISPVIARI
ncbi:MAG: hypothetical protein JWQ36_167 [Enterovirga sp.]|jgi:hypothetical protein|nr:hypothetical protein [Enterovirga sp.]